MDMKKVTRAEKLAKQATAAKARKTRNKERVVRQRAAAAKEFADGTAGTPSAATTGDAQLTSGPPTSGDAADVTALFDDIYRRLQHGPRPMRPDDEDAYYNAMRSRFPDDPGGVFSAALHFYIRSRMPAITDEEFAKAQSMYLRGGVSGSGSTDIENIVGYLMQVTHDVVELALEMRSTTNTVH